MRGNDADIFQRYVELTNRLWDTSSLSEEEKDFLQNFEVRAIAVLGPENFSEEIMNTVWGLKEESEDEPASYEETPSTEPAYEAYPRVAAASATEGESLYSHIRRLAESNREREEVIYEISVAPGRLIALFRIFPKLDIVRPIYNKDFAVFLEYQNQKPIAVSPYGVHSLTYPQMEKARVVVEEKKIRILL